MIKFTRKQIAFFGNEEELKERIRTFRAERHTSALPSPYDINVECIGYSVGYDGCNGSLFKDLTTGKVFGIPRKDETIYLR